MDDSQKINAAPSPSLRGIACLSHAAWLSSGSVENQQSYKLLLGKHGKSVSELYPTGQIEIEGLRYDARSSLGKIAKGENVEVFKVSEFELVVKPLES